MHFGAYGGTSSHDVYETAWDRKDLEPYRGTATPQPGLPAGIGVVYSDTRFSKQSVSPRALSRWMTGHFRRPFGHANRAPASPGYMRGEPPHIPPGFQPTRGGPNPDEQATRQRKKKVKGKRDRRRFSRRAWDGVSVSSAGQRCIASEGDLTGTHRQLGKPGSSIPVCGGRCPFTALTRCG